MASRVPMIRTDAIWLATEPIDMRAGVDTVLGRVVKVFGAAHVHHAYLFANRRANRMKVLVHDGFGLWLCARRLHQGHFVWPHSTPTSMSVPGTPDAPPSLTLSRAQLNSLVLGLPWQRLADAGAGAGAIHVK